MAKRLYDVLKDCNKEEEVKAEFCKFRKMKIKVLKSIDHYTPTVLFEFKYDRNFWPGRKEKIEHHVVPQDQSHSDEFVHWQHEMDTVLDKRME